MGQRQRGDAGVSPLDEEKRPRLETHRMDYTRARLLQINWHVEERTDGHSLALLAPSGKRFNFWPYSGWFQRVGASGYGRGFRNLLHAETST